MPTNAQAKAGNTVALAIRNGTLPSLKDSEIRCSDCGERATQYDHRDYNDPLSVAPVCRSCNMKRGPGANRGKIKRHWPSLHVRIERGTYEILRGLAHRQSRSIAEQATYLLQSAILSESLKERTADAT